MKHAAARLIQLESPFDKERVFALMTGAVSTPSGNIKTTQYVFESDDSAPEASYTLNEGYAFKDMGPIKSFIENNPNEHAIVLKHMETPCGMLVTAKMIIAIKEGRIATDRESVRAAIDTFVSEGEGRVAICKEEIDRVTRSFSA